MKKKVLKFSKQEIADLTKEEQDRVVGGVAPTHGENCTNTCGTLCNTYLTLGNAHCTDGCTGPCPSVHGGADCDPASGIENVTCYISFAGACHTDRACTYANCTGGCPNTYNDQTCGC